MSLNENCSVVSATPMFYTVLYSPWDSPGQNTGVGCCSLFQGIFPTQGSNPGLPHCKRILYQLSYQESHLVSLKLFQNKKQKKKKKGGGGSRKRMALQSLPSKLGMRRKMGERGKEGKSHKRRGLSVSWIPQFHEVPNETSFSNLTSLNSIFLSATGYTFWKTWPGLSQAHLTSSLWGPFAPLTSPLPWTWPSEDVGTRLAF